MGKSLRLKPPEISKWFKTARYIIYKTDPDWSRGLGEKIILKPWLYPGKKKEFKILISA